MPFAIFQAVLTAAACYGVWRFARKASPIVIAGFLIRAFAAQILFWISWLQLPIARSLQLGRGFWFFAIDGPWYLGYAQELIARGPKALLFVTGHYPSRIFTQAFTLFCAAFGVVAPTAILFNCVAYLATCALIMRIGRSRKTLALAAIAFGPSMILWSLQPLKDTFFFLLIVAFVFVCYRWQEMWRAATAPRWTSLLGCAAAMLAIVYAISGTRWYFGAIVWGASAVFFVFAAAQTRRGAWTAVFVSQAVVFLLLSQAFRFGGDTDIPEKILNVLRPRTLIEAKAEPLPVPVPVPVPVSVPKTVAVTAPPPAPALKDYLVASRKGFESTPGATAIHAGAAAARVPVASDVAATFIPRAAAQPLKLVRIGGGRGFWLLADFDTIVFSAVILFAIVACVRALRSGARVTPLFLFVVLVFFATAGPMIYSVTNFGTLFRLRQMLYVLAAIAPLTLLVVHTDAREVNADVREENREGDDRGQAHL